MPTIYSPSMAKTNGSGPRVVALLNQKGGVGKTTTTANLGHGLAIAGKRVCLIDLDPQGHLTLHLGIEAGDVERTVYDLMVDEECPVDDCVIREARPNLDVVLAEVDLAGAESELASRPDRRTILRDRFAAIGDRYDVVLIDCPPSLGLLTVNALTMADELFVPMQAHFLALQGVGRLLETVRLVCSSVNAELTVAGVILCMFERQTTLAKEILADLEDFFESYRAADVPWSECRVLQPPIRRNIKLAEAPSFGNTIFDYAPWCPGAIDYRRLAASLLERWGEAVEGLAPIEDDEEAATPVVGAAAEPVGTTSDAPGDAPAADAGPVSVGPASRGIASVAPPRTEARDEPDRAGEHGAADAGGRANAEIAGGTADAPGAGDAGDPRIAESTTDATDATDAPGAGDAGIAGGTADAGDSAGAHDASGPGTGSAVHDAIDGEDPATGDRTPRADGGAGTPDDRPEPPTVEVVRREAGAGREAGDGGGAETASEAARREPPASDPASDEAADLRASDPPPEPGRAQPPTIETPVRGDVAAPSRMPAEPRPGTTEIDGAREPDASPGPDVAVPDADFDPRAEDPDPASAHGDRSGGTTGSSDGAGDGDEHTGADAGGPPREPSNVTGDGTMYHGVRADLTPRGSHD